VLKRLPQEAAGSLPGLCSPLEGSDSSLRSLSYSDLPARFAGGGGADVGETAIRDYVSVATKPLRGLQATNEGGVTSSGVKRPSKALGK
jgi:hypothetical protein